MAPFSEISQPKLEEVKELFKDSKPVSDRARIHTQAWWARYGTTLWTILAHKLKCALVSPKELAGVEKKKKKKKKKKKDSQTPPPNILLQQVQQVWDFFCLFFLGPHQWQPVGMEDLRLGVQSELQLSAYITATATRDPSLICDLYHSSQQHWILNLRSKARDRSCVLMDASQIGFH